MKKIKLEYMEGIPNWFIGIKGIFELICSFAILYQMAIYELDSELFLLLICLVLLWFGVEDLRKWENSK